MDTTSKILIFFFTGLPIGVLTFGILIFVLTLMNGHNEDDAGYGLVLFFGWVLFGVIVSGLLSIWTASKLITKKDFTATKAGIVSVVVFSIIGFIFNIFGGFAGIALADIARNNF